MSPRIVTAGRGAAIAVAIVLTAPAARSGDARVSVFLNPYKYFLGLFNVGVEMRCGAEASICVSAEYAGVRTGYLKRIAHPDLVAQACVRYYPVPGERDLSGPYAGLSTGLFYTRPVEGRSGAMDLALGAETGYKWRVDESSYLVPRAALNRMVHGRKVLVGAEVLGGIEP